MTGGAPFEIHVRVVSAAVPRGAALTGTIRGGPVYPGCRVELRGGHQPPSVHTCASVDTDPPRPQRLATTPGWVRVVLPDADPRRLLVGCRVVGPVAGDG